MAIVSSCSQDENSSNPFETNLTAVELNFKTLDVPSPIGSDVILPVGTKWRFTDEHKGTVEFELPQGYEFLLYDNQAKSASISSIGAGYSCTCSGENSCTVFYSEDTGYGCVHGSCSGTCSGKNTGISTKFTIEGVLYTSNDIIDIKSEELASLSQKGREILSETKEYQKVLSETYDLFYKHIEEPNFDLSLDDILADGNYVMASGYLFGTEIAIVIPNQPETFKSLAPSLEISDKPKDCSCSGEGSACELKSKGAFGYRAWWCSGCTTCTMNME